MVSVLLMEIVFALNAAAPVSAELATANDTARFLAGLPPAANSPLAILTQDPLWQDHARHFNSIFAREDTHSLVASASPYGRTPEARGSNDVRSDTPQYQ